MKHLSGAPLLGRLLPLPTNISLGWKGWQRTNTLAYYEYYSRKMLDNIGTWLYMVLRLPL
jgi:hypothetical protein